MVNIFLLSWDVDETARMSFDRHVGKIAIEIATLPPLTALRRPLSNIFGLGKNGDFGENMHFGAQIRDTPLI